MPLGLTRVSNAFSKDRCAEQYLALRQTRMGNIYLGKLLNERSFTPASWTADIFKLRIPIRASYSACDELKMPGKLS
jgi:hypothetical protein